MSPTGDRTAILHGYPRDAKVVACSAKGIPSFPSYFKNLSIGLAPESNPYPSTPQPSSLPNKLIVP